MAAVALAGVALVMASACGSSDATETGAPATTASTDASAPTTAHEHDMESMDHDMESMDHDMESMDHEDGDDHHAEGAPEDDKGLSLIMNGAGEGGGHVHDSTVVELDTATQAQLDAQLAAMQPLIDSYPTVADAEAAGYARQGPYSPALGVHYSARSGSVSMGPTLSEEDLKHPMLIFDGVSPDSKLAGFMYNIFSLDKENPPEGFVGPNDQWHYHTDVCIVFNPDGSTSAPLGADTSATKELCDEYGGSLLENTGYMLHVWPVPGYESDEGLFSNLNSKLTCPNGTYYTIPMDEIGDRTSVCADVDF